MGGGLKTPPSGKVKHLYSGKCEKKREETGRSDEFKIHSQTNLGRSKFHKEKRRLVFDGNRTYHLLKRGGGLSGTMDVSNVEWRGGRLKVTGSLCSQVEEL